MTTPSWKEEFQKSRPKTDDKLLETWESESYYFGYKHREIDGATIHEVTDWGHIETFIAEKIQEAQHSMKEKCLAALPSSIERYGENWEPEDARWNDACYSARAAITAITIE